MRAVDTNVLVRLIVRDDVGQMRSADDFISGGAWVSHLVLAETICVLDAVYERTTDQIAAALQMLLNHKDLSLQDADTVISALEEFKKRPALGFTDCLTLQIAHKAGHLPLGTFGKDLAKLKGTQRLR